MKMEFPKGFLWGAATSAHQVEGGNIWNDWYEFEKVGKVKNKEVSGFACDHYHKFREDFDLAKSLGQNAHRLSIEWSRIEKEKGKFDHKEIEHYKEVLKYLKDNGFITFVTLHHFTNPNWFNKEGGWTKKQSIEYFIKYVKKVVPELNEYVDFWSTINEPMVLTSHGYLTGSWPPGKKRALFLFLKASINLKKAHFESYNLIKKLCPKSQVGIVYNFGFTLKNNPINNILNYFRNYWFVDKIKETNDFIGFNYYFPAGKTPQNLPRTDMNWPIFPKGLRIATENVYKRYQLPIYITENGIADSKDKKRKNFIKEHLKEMHNSIATGVDIRGYFYWSLLDNFEWAEGFEQRFGLVEIDYKTQKRTVRESAKLYAKMAGSNSLEV